MTTTFYQVRWGNVLLRDRAMLTSRSEHEQAERYCSEKIHGMNTRGDHPAHLRQRTTSSDREELKSLVSALSEVAGHGAEAGATRAAALTCVCRDIRGFPPHFSSFPSQRRARKRAPSDCMEPVPRAGRQASSANDRYRPAGVTP